MKNEKTTIELSREQIGSITCVLWNALEEWNREIQECPLNKIYKEMYDETYLLYQVFFKIEQDNGWQD